MRRLPLQVRLVLVTAALAATPLACNRNKLSREVPVLVVKTSSFPAAGAIPSQFSSCEGQVNDSPELSWQAPPDRTQSLALLVTDPDAPIGNFVHWVIYDLPPEMHELPQAIRKAEQLPNGSRQGTNDFGEIGYDGPCPPGHSAHRYVFDLYALDTRLNLSAGATKKQVTDAMSNHILAHGQLTGRYQR
jgi:Raf kinase inhibitor-like YbhB/YbcL family protein